MVAPYFSGAPSPPEFLENIAKVQPGPTRLHGTEAREPVWSAPRTRALDADAIAGGASAGTASPMPAVAAATVAAAVTARHCPTASHSLHRYQPVLS